MSHSNRPHTLFCLSGGLFGPKTDIPDEMGSHPDAAGSPFRRMVSISGGAGLMVPQVVANPAGVGSIPRQMGWLPGRKGIRSMPRGIAPEARGIYPAPQTREPAACGIQPAACGIEPEPRGAGAFARTRETLRTLASALMTRIQLGTANRELRTESA